MLLLELVQFWWTLIAVDWLEMKTVQTGFSLLRKPFLFFFGRGGVGFVSTFQRYATKTEME